MAPQTAPSSIAMALAGMSASVDIPKPRAGVTSAARDGPRSGQPAMLPTPPNSISPNLPPHSLKHRGGKHQRSPSVDAFPVDSDIDLGDSAHHPSSRPAGRDLDSAGAITPALLAEYHLPNMLLDQGPLAIRHLMGYLTTSVPGFSRIPPAKARRLIVAALESRGANSGGSPGDVIFEKVGWGRWDARRRGEPSREQLSPPASLSTSSPYQGMQIPKSTGKDLGVYRASMAGDSAAFSFSETGYGEDVNMLEDEADKMSLDGDARDCSSSEAPEDDVLDENWGEDDITDEEDWAHIGAAALRARTLNGGGGFVGSHVVAQRQQLPQLRGGGPAFSTLTKSAPHNFPLQPGGLSIPEGVVNDKEERVAVEALLRLGSM